MRVWGVRTAVAVIVLTALVSVVAASGDGPIRERPEPSVPNRGDSSLQPIPNPRPAGQADGLGLALPAWLWWLLGAIAAAAVVWFGAPIVRELVRRWRLARLRWRWPWRLRWPWRRRARTGTDESQPAEVRVVDVDEAEVAREAVDAALAPLRDPADPRAAVIEAYVRMEQVLAERALGRRSPEAPREYLRRVMREQGMPEAPLTTLTALFEEARFSHHPIPESAPRRAASELRIARAALAATRAVETG
jgi:Domain of unknown function (DUF4129)